MTVLKVPKKTLIGLGIIIFTFMLFYYSSIVLQPASKLSDKRVEKLLHIKPGNTVNQIAYQLSEENIIVDPLVFKLYLRFRGATAQVKAGYYRLSSKMTLKQIVNKLIRGEMASYKLTIPEGVTIENIAQRLAKKGLKEEKVLAVAKNKEVKFINLATKQRADLIYSLEGFLFPDTYQIPYGSSPQDIIEIMLAGFKEQIEPLRPEIKESKYNLFEIVTIASLIQAEGKLKKEFPLISSVIYNRLAKGMRLQIDATVQYVLPERKARLLYEDLKENSPYNTYLNSALPPGPINNPGLKAIKAALNPAQTDYLYYVAIGEGKHEFSKTYQEHLKIQQKLKDSGK